MLFFFLVGGARGGGEGGFSIKALNGSSAVVWLSSDIIYYLINASVMRMKKCIHVCSLLQGIKLSSLVWHFPRAGFRISQCISRQYGNQEQGILYWHAHVGFAMQIAGWEDGYIYIMWSLFSLPSHERANNHILSTVFSKFISIMLSVVFFFFFCPGGSSSWASITKGSGQKQGSDERLIWTWYANMMFTEDFGATLWWIICCTFVLSFEHMNWTILVSSVMIIIRQEWWKAGSGLKPRSHMHLFFSILEFMFCLL